MTTSTEVELTFLAAAVPQAIRGLTGEMICDRYIGPIDPASSLRLRRKGARYEITRKVSSQPGDASAHLEHTIPLSASEYEALQQAPARIVQKLRYSVPLAGHQADIDLFLGELLGLVLIEFELAMEEIRTFRPPPDCLCDVTQENFISGSALAGCSYDDISDRLARLGYRPLLPAVA